MRTAGLVTATLIVGITTTCYAVIRAFLPDQDDETRDT